MSEPTPGQLACEAYWQVHAQEGYVQVRLPFAGMPEVSQRAWDAAAQAVLDAAPPATGHPDQPVARST